MGQQVDSDTQRFTNALIGACEPTLAEGFVHRIQARYFPHNVQVGPTLRKHLDNTEKLWEKLYR